MNARERLFAVLRGEPTDRTPIWLLFPYQQTPYYADVRNLPVYCPVLEASQRSATTLDRRNPKVKLFHPDVKESNETSRDGAAQIERSSIEYKGKRMFAEKRRQPEGTTVKRLLCSDEDLEFFCALPVNVDPVRIAAELAAALCVREHCLPADLAEQGQIPALQIELLRAGQFNPGVRLLDSDDLARRATVSASSQLRLAELPANGPSLRLDNSWAQMLPLNTGRVPRVTFLVDVARATESSIELRASNRPDNFTPDILLRKSCHLSPGDRQPIVFDFDIAVDAPRYLFYCLRKNQEVAVYCSNRRVTGVVSATQEGKPAVSNFGAPVPPAEISIESFEFWCPERRPGGHNLAMTIAPPLDGFAPANAVNGVARPTNQPNAWVAAFDDPRTALTLRWDEPQKIARVELSFDTDFDHPMETLRWGHAGRAMPFCVQRYRIRDESGRIIAEQADNHQARNTIVLEKPIMTCRLEIELMSTHGGARPSLFEIRCCAS